MKKQRTLKKEMLKITMVPLVLLAALVIGVSISTLNSSLTSKEQKDMQQTAQLVLKMYDRVYPGDFAINLDTEHGTYTVLKGEADITKAYGIIDEISQSKDLQISIFCRNIRVLTTLKNDDGKRYLSTKASSIVEREVLEQGSSKFYPKVTVEGKESFAYYQPIALEDGTVYGMIGICKNSEEVRKGAISNIGPVVVACIAMAFILGIVILSYTNRLSSRIEALDDFMNSVAGGDFRKNMPRNVFSGEDEIARLGTNGKKMQASLREMVETDMLTGLNNRRYAEKGLAETITRCDLTGIPICVCIGDIDFFKRVNDTYGHEAGDAVLKNVADRLIKGVAKRGFVARWGGEEFLIVLENMKLDESENRLNEILESIRAMDTYFDDQLIKVTMSFGVTAYGSEDTKETVLRRADELLYYAKTHDRNQVVAR